MPNLEPTIQCSNPHCVAFNNFNRRFCIVCKTPMIKRYLWAIGEQNPNSEIKHEVEPQQILITHDHKLTNQDLPEKQTNSTLEQPSTQRYLPISDRTVPAYAARIFLDTQPGETPQIAEKLPEEIVSYLQLFSYFPHIPQVYGQLDGTQIWLLDYGTVPVNNQGKLLYSDLLPEMTSVWTQATSFKQLNWLRQIANLWKPLAEKRLNATLLNPQLIRVNSSFVQLLQLQANLETKPTLQNLGTLWQKWSQQANKDIQDVVTQLSQRMENGTIKRIEQVVTILEQAIGLYSQFQQYSYESFAISDSGPKRSNNQDQAYPHGEKPTKNEESKQSLTIVCDGVGGHEGGEIASQETVNYLSDRINNQISWEQRHNYSTYVLQQLLQFTNEVNDAISQRNDNEKRQDRQRMGTTLVMTLAHNHEVFLSHVGDSRIYLITNNSCHQLTIDDDLASREVRLGYAVYRDALKYPSAGALIQAIGMRHSTGLHPNLQRLIVDDDCVLLLCTDGLSDYDRVEQYWRDVIVPVLEHGSDLTKAVQTLVKIGNEKNGHDNVTAALVHCQIKPKSPTSNTIITWSEVEASIKGLLSNTNEIVADPILPQQVGNSNSASLLSESKIIQAKNLLHHRSRSAKSPFFTIGMILSFAFLVSLGVLIYAYIQNNREEQQFKPNPPELGEQETINEQ